MGGLLLPRKVNVCGCGSVTAVKGCRVGGMRAIAGHARRLPHRGTGGALHGARFFLGYSGAAHGAGLVILPGGRPTRLRPTSSGVTVQFESFWEPDRLLYVTQRAPLFFFFPS